MALKFKRDFRLRDQVQRIGKFLGTNSRQVRILTKTVPVSVPVLNFEDQVNDKVKVVVGIATDGGTARSNNYTLGRKHLSQQTGISNVDAFGKPEIVLNKAYAVYTPNSMITVMGGKLDNPIWEPAGASFFWDPDITPEGGTIQLQKKLNDYITPWAQGAVLDLHDQTPTANASSSGCVDRSLYDGISRRY